jgi:peptidoglycan-associated lipoprotein
MSKSKLNLMALATVSITLSFLIGGCAETSKVDSPDRVSPATRTQPAATYKPPAKVPRKHTAALEEENIDEGPGQPEPLDSTYDQDQRYQTAELIDTPTMEGRTPGPMLPIYFDFDKSNISGEQRERIEKDASILKSNPGLRVRIEGNCDERGTNEYNMALGERRATSARKYMVNLGVESYRIETISYGEEKPLLYGHGELSWAQNRRADVIEIR